MDQTKIESNATPASSGEEAGVALSELVESFTEADVERVLAAQRAFPAQIAQAWLKLGYAIVPMSKTGKDPISKYKWIKDTERGHTETCLQKEIDDGAFTLSARAGLVLDGLQGVPALSVMDLDVANMEQVARSRLPATPLEVTTGRVGGGRHFYYLRDPAGAQRGSRTGLSTVGCDYKGKTGVCVAPGSVHASGLVYRAFWQGVEVAPDSITAEMLASLPTLPDALVQTLIDEDVQAKRAAKLGFHDLSMEKGSAKQGKTTRSGLERVKAEDTAVFRHGALKGLTVAQAALQLGPGHHNVCCPHDGHKTDANGKTTATLNVTDLGEAHLTTCHACSKVYIYRRGAKLTLAYTAKGGLKTGTPGYTIVTDDYGYDRVVVGREALSPEGWVDFPLAGKIGAKHMGKSPKVLILQAGQGRGKSHFAGLMSAFWKSKKGRRVAVSPTISLADDLGSKLSLPSYRETTGRVEGDVAICAPSLYRAPSWDMDDQCEIVDQGADFFFVDEIEQICASLLGRHLDDHTARRAHSALLAHLRNAKQIVLADADAGPCTRKLLEQAGYGPGDVLWIEAPPAEPRPIQTVISKVGMWAAIKEGAALGRVAVAVQGIVEAHAIAKNLDLHDGLPTLIVSSDTASELDMRKINDLCAAHGHLVYTPAMATGVSIDLKGFYQKVFLLIADGVGTASSAMQIANRVRHPIDRTLTVCRLACSSDPKAWELDAKTVKRTWFKREGQTLKASKFIRELPEDIALPSDPYAGVNFAALAYVDLVAEAWASEARSGKGRVTDTLLRACEAAGWPITPFKADKTQDEMDAIFSVRREARAAVKGEDVQAVVTSAALTTEELEEVRKRGAKTKGEKLSLRRSALERAYGPGAADDEELVAWDDRGRNRGKMRSLAEAVAWDEGGQAREALRKADQKQLAAGTAMSRLGHRSVKAACRAKLLNLITGGTSAAGFSYIYNQTPGLPAAHPLTSCTARAVATYLHTPEGKVLMETLGLTVRKDAAENPMTQIADILRTFGLRLNSRQRGHGETATREYSLDLKALEAMRSRCAHHLARLRLGGATPGEDEHDDGEDEFIAALNAADEALLQGIMQDLKAA